MRRPAARPAAREVDELTEVGDLYVRSLVRAQLRQAVSVLAVVGIALGTLPLVFMLLPALDDVRVATVPLPWLLLGVAVYPVLMVIAWWHVGRAEETERRFAELLHEA